ncbi:hypothetical protein ZIOFF_016945 [Zingiber officinale]|uniref:Secreted protein n=1 Tax=Zingiber officinale TaxID=94328 RepID=A0A8J5LHZ6_ZINOF|nr:hypothetical protein ZIOFF_016945 [Zingiber officinale]
MQEMLIKLLIIFHMYISIFFPLANCCVGDNLLPFFCEHMPILQILIGTFCFRSKSRTTMPSPVKPKMNVRLHNPIVNCSKCNYQICDVSVGLASMLRIVTMSFPFKS